MLLQLILFLNQDFVNLELTTVIPMQCALTLLEVSYVGVTVDTVGVE
jgi:hypothetical protein